MLLATVRVLPHHEAIKGLAMHLSDCVTLAVGSTGVLAMLNLIR